MQKLAKIDFDKLLAVVRKGAIPTVGGAAAGAALMGGLGQINNDDPDPEERHRRLKRNLLMGAGLGGVFGGTIGTMWPDITAKEEKPNLAQSLVGGARGVTSHAGLVGLGAGVGSYVGDKHRDHGIKIPGKSGGGKDSTPTSINALFSKAVDYDGGSAGSGGAKSPVTDPVFNPANAQKFVDSRVTPMLGMNKGWFNDGNDLSSGSRKGVINALHRTPDQLLAAGRELAPLSSEVTQRTLALDELKAFSQKVLNEKLPDGRALGDSRPNPGRISGLPGRLMDAFRSDTHKEDTRGFTKRMLQTLMPGKYEKAQGPTLNESVQRGVAPWSTRSPLIKSTGKGVLYGLGLNLADRAIMPVVESAVLGHSRVGPEAVAREVAREVARTGQR